jgi:hypothetical protein
MMPGMIRPLKVFISSTSEMWKYPYRRSFVQAAQVGVARYGGPLASMTSFPAEYSVPADTRRGGVIDCDVYVALLGFRYEADRRPGLSHVEFEFNVATDRGVRRYMFLLDSHAEVDFGLFHDPDSFPRQKAFRSRVEGSGATVKVFRTADELERGVSQALTECASRLVDVSSQLWSPGEKPADQALHSEPAQLRSPLIDSEVPSSDIPGYLINLESSDVADVAQWSTREFTPIIGFPRKREEDVENQLWRFEANGQNFLVKSEFAIHMALDAVRRPGSHQPVDSVVLTTIDGRDSQNWKLVPHHQELFYLVDANSGNCVTYLGRGKPLGLGLPTRGDGRQLWRFEPLNRIG